MTVTWHVKMEVFELVDEKSVTSHILFLSSFKLSD